MATLVNEGLTGRAKLTGGITGTAFTKYVLIGTGLPAEAATVGYADIQTHLLSGNGGGPVTVSSITYVANYKTQWQHTFSFTGDLTIYGIGIINTDDGSPKLLMYHVWTTPIVVHNLETAQITSTETEGRA